MTEVPSGWRRVTLGEVAETALGKMLDKGKSKGYPHVPYLRNVNVQWGRIDTDDVLTMELADDERDRFGVLPGDLLVCEGGEVGRAAIWTHDGGFIAYQKALHRVRPGDNVDARFLRYMLEYSARAGVLVPLTTGSTIAHLPQQSLRKIPFLLPPLSEQERIVEVLEDYLSRLDAGTDYLDAAAQRLSVIGDALFASAGELVGLEPVRLDSLIAEKLSNGRSVPTADSGFPVLRLTAMKNGRIDLEERKIGRWTAEEASPFLVVQDDVLVARGNGSIRLVGRAAMVVDEPDAVAFPDTMIRIRPDRTKVLPEYLSLAWNSRVVRRQIESTARTTAGIYKVSQKDLQKILFPAPGLPAQQTILERMGEHNAAVQRLSRQVEWEQARAGSLRRAILAAAFSGRLTGATSDLERVEELAADIVEAEALEGVLS
ncbi:restriction endonuclease subunit S [Streptomyces sp. NPDC054933]